MVLRKFKGENNKKIGIIAFTIACVLLIAGVFLYKTFAIFEVTEEQNIMNGTVKDPGDLYFALYVDNTISSSIPTKDSGYTLDTTKSTCNNGVTISWDDINWSAITNFTNYVQNNDSRTKCTLYFRKGINISSQIIAQLDTTGSCPTVNEDGTVNVTSTESANGYVCSAPDDYGTSYYFRGNVTNNYVKFGGYYWRIIRMNGDGSIRMIYVGDASVIDALDEATKQSILANGYNDSTTNYTRIGESDFNKYSNAAYAGYMYGSNIWKENVSTKRSYKMSDNFYYDTTYTFDSFNGTFKLTDTATQEAWNDDKVGKYTCLSSTKECKTLYYVEIYEDDFFGSLTTIERTGTTYEEMCKNENDSIIKTIVDNWYKDHIFDTEYEQYISDTLFCNDRSIRPDSGWPIVFRWYYGPGDDAQINPTLKCKQQNDRFTMSDTTVGNKALTYPIGLITLDDVVLAGGYNTKNTSYYLYTGNSYWTMTPSLVTDTDVHGFYLEGDGSTFAYTVYRSYDVRPVINLKAGSLKSGTGVWNDPYMIG